MTTNRVIRVAAVQIAPDRESAMGTVDKVCRTILEAGEKGAKMVVFPETFVPYYPYFSFVEPPVKMGPAHLKLYEWAVTVPGPVTRAVGEAARKAGAVVVLGINERDHGSLYNTQLIFDETGEIILKRRKITPTYHERMVWGQGDGSGLKVVETGIGRIGALACWEHYNPLARYALMAQHEEIHASQFPGSMVGEIFAEQIAVTIRHHALESGCFVVNATGWLTDEQIASITPDPGLQRALRGGCHTAIVTPEGNYLGEPIREGEGILIADLDMALITKRKRMMDSVGHYARPELLSLLADTGAKTPMRNTADNSLPLSPTGANHVTDSSASTAPDL
ncbi:Nit6803 family nitrilase [Dechloromonas hortensis]|uniref:Nit6803 family nitrilase n=1 Tax=Dechloromonas hortensis TaxID=337779 RepID=UPI00129145D8|nr:Nit6803 family nitrilase [Dechloromonas hortensis]